MNRSELERILRDKKISPLAYSLDGGRRSQRTNLRTENGCAVKFHLLTYG
jgi:hypothetical protein